MKDLSSDCTRWRGRPCSCNKYQRNIHKRTILANMETSSPYWVCSFNFPLSPPPHKKMAFSWYTYLKNTLILYLIYLLRKIGKLDNNVVSYCSYPGGYSATRIYKVHDHDPTRVGSNVHEIMLATRYLEMGVFHYIFWLIPFYLFPLYDFTGVLPALSFSRVFYPFCPTRC